MRIFARHDLVCGLFLWLLLCFCEGRVMAGEGHTKRDNERPNVIIILTDDQGYGDLSVHGNPILKTPVLDQLHDQSIRFHNFHVAPMCTPTRGQLMTGRDAMDNGATMVNQGRSMMREALPTMADVFKMSGYHTAHFGKWHLGDSYPHRPQDRGFEETVHHGAWGVTSMASYYSNDYWDDNYSHNGQLEKYEGYCTDVWFDLAIDYLKKQKKEDAPFFIYLATNAAHWPHRVDDKYSAPYLAKGMKPEVAKFFGQIANIDENVGRLLTTLDETHLTEDTMVIFMTDNGTVKGHEVYNADMRGHKTSPYEGGHRVPLFIRWPNGTLGEPRVIDELIQVQDLLPTLIDLCKLKEPRKDDFDGTSLAPLLEGKVDQLDDRMLIIQYGNPYQPKEDKVVLWKDWRLVKNSELYELSKDPGQHSDVAAAHPDIVAKMQAFYHEWLDNTLPDYHKKRFIHIGSEKQNPLMLYSCDWQGDYADGLWNLIEGDDTGFWDIMVETSGKYRITFYRWHPASGFALDAPYSADGKEEGAVPVALARLRVGEIDQMIEVPSGSTNVTFIVDLQKGPKKIETWLMDENENILCSAYYTKVEMLDFSVESKKQ